MKPYGSDEKKKKNNKKEKTARPNQDRLTAFKRVSAHHASKLLRLFKSSFFLSLFD